MIVAWLYGHARLLARLRLRRLRAWIVGYYEGTHYGHDPLAAIWGIRDDPSGRVNAAYRAGLARAASRRGTR
jgi:hypothetical protein